MSARDIISFIKATPKYRELLLVLNSTRIGKYEYFSLTSEDKDAEDLYGQLQSEIKNHTNENVSFLKGVHKGIRFDTEDLAEIKVLSVLHGITLKYNARVAPSNMGLVIFSEAQDKDTLSEIKKSVSALKASVDWRIILVSGLVEEKEIHEVFFTRERPSYNSSELLDEDRDRGLPITEDHIVDLHILLEEAQSCEDILSALEKVG